MSIIGSELLLGSSEQYQIERSLRFNPPDSTLLFRSFGTPTGSNFTFSFWVKRSSLGTEQHIFSATTQDSILFGVDDRINLRFGGVDALAAQNRFRDPSAWYHIVLVKSGSTTVFYVNGVFVRNIVGLSFSTLGTAVAHQIGAINGTNYLAGYLADVNFIDGQVLTPDSFGAFDSNGNWQPRSYTGTYGNNGFHLEFKTTSGTDTSGRGNNWTAFNFGTSGAGNDGLVDTPTDYGTDTGVGGEIRGNYCTLSTITKGTAYVGNNGSLDVPPVTEAFGTHNLLAFDKAYWEVTSTGGSTLVGASYGTTPSIILIDFMSAGKTYGFRTTYSGGTTTLESRNITDGGSWVSAGSYSISEPLVIWISAQGGTTANLNAGQRPFAATAPSGYKCICTTNMSTPIITKPSTVVDTKLYTGNGSTQTISGLQFSPDFVWIKNRATAGTVHCLFDTVRGATNVLSSNNDAPEASVADTLTSFNSDGFSLGANTQLNANAAAHVAWTWDAGSSTVTNTSGSITSQVRANASTGFSIVTYTGAGGTATVGHGLGVTPSLVIVKNRVFGGNWQVRHTSIAAANSIQLNSTAAAAAATTVWNSTAPTSTVFSIGNNSDVNFFNDPHVAYCWAPVAGYSAFGSYTGNGNVNGPFVHLGFRPAVILIKMSSSTGNWVLLDYQRDGYNVDNDALFPNLTNAESTTDLADIVSNGFKIRTTDASVNTNTGTYIYAAWAQTPFKYTRAR